MLPTMRAIPPSDRDVGGPNLFVRTKAKRWCGRRGRKKKIWKNASSRLYII